MNKELKQILQDGEVEKLKELIGAGADLNQKVDGESLLIKAIKYNNLEIATLLIEGGASMNTMDMSHRRPVVLAKFYKHKAIQDYLTQIQNRIHSSP